MAKYKLLKPITAHTIYTAGDKTCQEFREEFQLFLKWAWSYDTIKNTRTQFYFFEEISLLNLEEAFDEHPSWAEFLIAHQFIEKIEEEVFYSVGDRFIYKETSMVWSKKSYRLCIVGPNNALQLIAEDGTRYYGSPPINVNASWHVTKDEFRRIARNTPHLFEKIEEK